MESTSSANPRRRAAARATFLIVAAFIAIDAIPEVSLFHRRAKKAIDGVMDVTGLWQGTWNLFAPEVDKINARVVAEIHYSGGGTATWQSPDWHTMSASRRFFTFRHQEYFDKVRLDANRAAWEPLARHLAATVRPPEGAYGSVSKVVLTRWWAEIPPPGARDAPPAGPYVTFDRTFTFYTWNAK